jgi:phosphopantothenoylcysteine decarboxylase / phosphopantothenate---cysteine ligase
MTTSLPTASRIPIRVLVTAGPTREALDPVRYLSNHSTGKMGYALAENLAARGAQVTLISGPTQLIPVHPGIHLVNVLSAADMYDACRLHFAQSDLAILSAAVADYTPKVVATNKIKKKEAEFCLELVKTIDIAAALGRQKRRDQWLVGFALETEHEMTNAFKKLTAKNLDGIVLNSLRDPGAGFGYDTNQVSLISRQGEVITLPLQSKQAVAEAILKWIAGQMAREMCIKTNRNERIIS